MLPTSRSVEGKVDPVVASLTPSQKRQIIQLYGGGTSQPGDKWEPVPHLTLEQIRMVMAEQNSQHPYSPHDYRTTQTGTVYHQQQPFMGPPSAGNVPRPGEQYSSGPSPRHSAPFASSAYPPPPQYQQSSSHPSLAHPPPLHQVPADSRNQTSNPPSLSSIDNRDMSTDNDYYIMVIGVTGSGKSTACNFFLNQKVFNTKGGAVSVTTKSDAHSGTVLGSKVLFIDTPGFSDAYESEEQRMVDLGRALYFAQNGVHAIVVCFDGAARFDTATEGVVNVLDQLGTFWPHAFILYSHADDMGSTESEQKQQVHQWIDNPRCPERLKWLLQQVQYRFMTVESRMRANDHSYHQQKCKELINLVEEVYKSNGCQLYTNQLFKWAKQKYDKAKQEKKKQEEELQKSHERVKEYEELLKSFQEENIVQQGTHQRQIDNLQEEIKSLQLEQQQSSLQQQEREELHRQQLQKEAMAQKEIAKLNSIVQEQKEMFEQMRQAQSAQLEEQSRLQSLQAQSAMEQYMKSMQEDMRAIKAENKERTDKFIESQRQQTQDMHAMKAENQKLRDRLMESQRQQVQEDMHAMKAENQKLRDRMMESQRQQVQPQPSTKSDNSFGDTLLGIAKAGAKIIGGNCSIM